MLDLESTRSCTRFIEQGAATSVWAAVGAEMEGVGGPYLEDCNESPVWSAERPMIGYKPYARDSDSAARLWQTSADLTDVKAE